MNDATMQELESQIRELQEQNQQQVTKVAVLEEKMNTKQAETETSIERLRADMADWKTYVVRAIYASAVLAAALMGILFHFLDRLA